MRLLCRQLSDYVCSCMSLDFIPKLSVKSLEELTWVVTCLVVLKHTVIAILKIDQMETSRIAEYPDITPRWVRMRLNREAHGREMNQMDLCDSTWVWTLAPSSYALSPWTIFTVSVLQFLYKYRDNDNNKYLPPMIALNIK